MDTEKVANFIKELRRKNGLTQRELADKYNVSYQAVSKWENAKCLPDIIILKEICHDYNVNLEDIFAGEFPEEVKAKKRGKIFIVILVLLVILLGLFFFFNYRNNNLNFSLISSSCKNFKISGNLVYNNKMSAIYVTNIDYCGEDKNIIYDEIECTLLETSSNIEAKVSSYKEDKKTSLEDFLKRVTFGVNNYKSVCKEYSIDSFHLIINAKKEGKITTYDVPLILNNGC